MNDLIAKPVVKNKFWIVEQSGSRVATIQAIDEAGGFAYVHDNEREVFPTIKLISKKYNIQFAKADKPTRPAEIDVYGFPVTGAAAYNQVLDVQRYLPIYTKQAKSKSFFCAGHYLVQFGRNWTLQTCPKMITLNRYTYQGPFKTRLNAETALKDLNG
jgi:hypothetical protein